MATTFEKLSSNKVKLGFVVHSEQFDEGIRKAYAKNAKKFNIPGFRRGKAPMKIIENFYGAFGTFNVVGGFLVTDRMLEMFKKRPEPKKAEGAK